MYPTENVEIAVIVYRLKPDIVHVIASLVPSRPSFCFASSKKKAGTAEYEATYVIAYMLHVTDSYN